MDEYKVSLKIGVLQTLLYKDDTSDVVYLPRISTYFESYNFKYSHNDNLWFGAGLVYDSDTLIAPALSARYYFYINNLYYSTFLLEFSNHVSISFSLFHIN